MILEKTEGEKIYNVGSGKATSLRKILEFLCSLSEQKIDIKVNPKLIRPIENKYICCDRTLITSETGWEPVYDIFDTVKEIFEYYLKLQSTSRM